MTLILGYPTPSTGARAYHVTTLELPLCVNIGPIIVQVQVSLSIKPNLWLLTTP